MPCRTDGWAEADLRDEVSRLKPELDRVTRLLCEASKLLFDEAYESPDWDELERWHLEHMEADRVRLRKEAIAKLTPEEIAALGLALPR